MGCPAGACSARGRGCGGLRVANAGLAPWARPGLSSHPGEAAVLDSFGARRNKKRSRQTGGQAQLIMTQPPGLASDESIAESSAIAQWPVE